MTGTLFATRELSQITENVQLPMRYLDVPLEEDPSDALVARWCCQGAQVRPVPVII